MPDTGESTLVEYDCSEHIATITLNRPDKLNAVNDDMVRQIAAALRRFDTDNEARVAILCGRGRAFSSGADVQQRQLRSRAEFERHGGAQAQDASSHDLFLRAVNWKPVLAAPHGYVLGLALGLVLESRPDRGGGGHEIPGDRDAARTVRCQVLGTAEFPRRRRLCHRCQPDRPLLHRRGGVGGRRDRPRRAAWHLYGVARELAAAVAKNPPFGVRSTVRARRWYLEQLSREVLLQVNLAKLHLTEDFAESARAFAEKRPAGPFKGR